jgi:Ser/Thr protein kinase RdoA (MazF antagonist)
MIRYADSEEAKKIVPRWGGSSSSVEHIGNHGSSIFLFKNSSDQLQILRFTDPNFRSYEEVIAELEFLNHLHRVGVGVAPSLPTKEGSLAAIVPCAVGDLICSSVEFAVGVDVQENTINWNPQFFHAWGRNLAEIHNASGTFHPPTEGPLRWQWDTEILFAQAGNLIPSDDRASLDEFYEVLERCNALAKSSSNFGLIHADHAPQNFRYDPVARRITAFDFGNSCYHWFIADIAISLSTVRRKQNRNEIRENILNGYSTARTLPPNAIDLINLFIRLRVVYVYLSRLHMWSGRRTPEQEQTLVELKTRVHAKTGWS